MPAFVAREWRTSGGGDSVATVLDRDCADFGHLVGRLVLVDGVEFRCTGVKTPATPPYKKGEAITLEIAPPR